MSYTTTYQVVRPFPGHREVGAILKSSDFASSHRAAQLLDQRFIAPVMVQSGYQPSVMQLVETPIRELRLMIGDVVDAVVLEAAMKHDKRDVALKIYEKRLEELNAQSIN